MKELVVISGKGGTGKTSLTASFAGLAGQAVIADCEEFRIRRVPLKKGAQLPFAAGEQCRLLSVVRGRLRVRGADLAPFIAGDNALLPFAGAFIFEADEDSLVLVTENFS